LCTFNKMNSQVSKYFKLTYFLAFICIIQYNPVKACQDPTIQELGWVFKLKNGDFQLFGLRNNAVYSLAELRAIRTNYKGDTLSVNFTSRLYFPFSFNVVMDMRDDGSFYIAGIQDSSNAALIKIISLDSNINISNRQTLNTRSDSFANLTSLTLRNIHGLGFLLFGISSKNTSYYSSQFIDFNDNVSNYPERFNSSSYTKMADAIMYKGHILIAGDGDELNFEGQELRIANTNGKILNWGLYINQANMLITATQITQVIPLSDNNIAICGYYSDNGNSDKFFIAKLDSNLDTLWTHIIDAKTFDPSNQLLFLDILGVTPTSSGGFGLLLKSFRNNIYNSSDILTNFDKDGNMTWRKDLGQYQCLVYNFIESSKNNFSLSVTSIANEGTDLHLLNFNTLDSSGNLFHISNPGQVLTLYPNPVTSDLNIEINNGTPGKIKIYDMTGKALYEVSNMQGSFYSIPMENFANGMYFLNYSDANGHIYNAKFTKR